MTRGTVEPGLPIGGAFDSGSRAQDAMEYGDAQIAVCMIKPAWSLETEFT